MFHEIQKLLRSPTLATRDLRDLVSSAPATVVGVYFRENAVAHLRSWTEPLSSKGARTMEVCCVESLLFRAGPLRSLVLRGLRANAEKRLQGKNQQSHARSQVSC